MIKVVKKGQICGRVFSHPIFTVIMHNHTKVFLSYGAIYMISLSLDLYIHMLCVFDRRYEFVSR